MFFFLFFFFFCIFLKTRFDISMQIVSTEWNAKAFFLGKVRKTSASCCVLNLSVEW